MAKKAQANFQENPLLTVIGGVALGAIAATLLPKSAREDKALGKAGKKLRKRAREAAKAAKQTGLDHLDNMGLNRDFAATQLRDIAGKLGKVASAAGSAAADAARKT